MFACKAGTYLSEAPFRCPTLGRLLALTANIRQGWKELPGTNALADYEKALLTAVKSKKFYNIHW
jgi:hypothetical protein